MEGNGEQTSGPQLWTICPSPPFPRSDTLQYLGTSLVLRQESLLASCALRPVMLLNVVQCPGQLHSTKNYPANNVNNAKVEKFCFKLENDTLIIFFLL